MSDILPVVPVLTQNLGLIVALAFVISMASGWRDKMGPLRAQFLCGGLFGLGAIICMSNPFAVAPGSIVDLRNVMIYMAAPFGGPIAGLVAGALAAAFRVYLGGAGAPVGAASIVLATLVGIVAALRFGPFDRVYKPAIIVLVQRALSLPLVIFFSPGAFTMSTIAQLFAPVVVFEIVGTILLWGVLTIESRRSLAERALQKSEQRFRDLAEVSSDWFWETGPDHRLTWITPRVVSMTGHPAEWFIGKRRDEIAGLPPEEMADHMRALAQHKPFRDFRYPLTAGDGRTLYLSVSGKPIFDERGSFRGNLGCARDVTDEVLAQQEQDIARRHAEEASELKSTFLANMSHELRTPLNAIIGFSEVIRDEVLGPVGNPRYREYAADLSASGRYLLGLINDILDLSKIEAGRFSLEQEENELAVLADAALVIVARRAEQKGVTIRVALPPDLPRLMVDTRATQQVLINLLSNAIKFTPPGGDVRVAAWLRPDGGLDIEVADTGIGIPADEQTRVFQPFMQARNRTAGSREGTGLGLPLSRRLVALHGGTLDLESEPGKGTRMRISLPSACVLAPESTPRDTPEETPGGAARDGPGDAAVAPSTDDEPRRATTAASTAASTGADAPA